MHTHVCIQVLVSDAQSSSLSQIISSLKTSLSETEKDVHPAASKPAPAPAAPAKCISWTDLSSDPPCMRRQTVEGVEQVGVLAKGPEGCATVSWPDGREEATDLSNLLLVPKVTLKRPAAAEGDSLLKKPAAAAGAPCLKKPCGHFPVRRKPAAKEMDTVAARSDLLLEHDVLYYKHGHRVGIREKADEKRQVFSFGGSACGATVEQLKAIGNMCCKKLTEGWSLQGTKDWAIDSLK